jgi:phage portal protein BeeE
VGESLYGNAVVLVVTNAEGRAATKPVPPPRQTKASYRPNLYPMFFLYKYKYKYNSTFYFSIYHILHNNSYSSNHEEEEEVE